MSQFLSAMNNPVVFLILVTLGVTAMQYVLAMLFHWIGWHAFEKVFNSSHCGGAA